MAVQTIENVKRLPPYIEGLQKDKEAVTVTR